MSETTKKQLVIYRFKTKKEFIEEYGLNWENIIPFGWNEKMNIFFGKEIKKSFYFKVLNNDANFVGDDGAILNSFVYKEIRNLSSNICMNYSWHISPYMLKSEIKFNRRQ